MEINELKNQFLNYLVQYKGRSLNTKNAYEFDLTRFINHLKSKDVTEAKSVTTRIIEDYLFYLKCSAITKARVKSSIKSFFHFLARKEYIEVNPTTRLESMKLPEKSPEYLSKEQRLVFLKTIENK